MAGLVTGCAAGGSTSAGDDTAAALTPARSAVPVPGGLNQRVQVTFYAAADNDPAGSTDIAYANSRHAAAGGTGTFADPLSLASDPRELRPGTVVYYPPIQKYFVMEDDCAPCIHEWAAHRTPHVDLWMSATTDRRVQACEAALSPDNPDTIVVNPPPGLPVDRRTLYDAAGHCWPATAPSS